MISKEQFCKIVERLRDYNDLQNKIQDLFKDNIDNQEMDFMSAGSICVGHETIVVQLLENMFNDVNTLTYWMYECDYGRKFKIGMMSVDGIDIDLTTPEKLYDYLVKEMEKKK